MWLSRVCWASLETQSGPTEPPGPGGVTIRACHTARQGSQGCRAARSQ